MFRLANNNSARASHFLYISLLSLHDYDVKLTSGRKQATMKLIFQQTQPTYEVDIRIRTQATLVGGECSHHCVIPCSLSGDSVSKSNTVLDSGFHAVDSEFLILNSGLQSSVGFSIPWTVFRIPMQDSGFRERKFPSFRNPDYLTWGDK